VREKILKSLRQIFVGMCIGCADIVPGISGGTVAFIMGVYEELLQACASFDKQAFVLLFTLQWRKFFKKVAWEFLLTTLFGVACAFIMLAGFITFLLHHELYRSFLYALFLGLVVGSTFFCVKQVSSWSFKTLVSAIVGVAIAFSLSSGSKVPFSKETLYDIPLLVPQEVASRASNYDQEKGQLLHVPVATLEAMVAKGVLSKEATCFVGGEQKEVRVSALVEELGRKNSLSFFDPGLFVCGIIAISAMLLPGISGSYMLTILGVYGYVLGSLLDFLKALKELSFDSAAFAVLLSLGMGILVGGALFCRVVSFLLSRFRNTTLATLIGFMIGALPTVWPFCSYRSVVNPLRLASGVELEPTTLLLPEIMSVHFLGALGFCLVGFCLVLVIEAQASKKSVQQRVV
jgi:putative membrane protein